MDTVFCTKLQQHAQALAKPPLPGAIGQRILREIICLLGSYGSNNKPKLLMKIVSLQ